MVDEDPNAYPEALLFEWKRQHADFVRGLVGKGFELVWFEQYARARGTTECLSLLAFIENRRVFHGALNIEFPPHVATSLFEVRTRLVEATTHLLPGGKPFASVSAMRDAIVRFLDENPTLQTLRCFGGDAVFDKFVDDLERLRQELLPHVMDIAASVDRQLSPAILAEAARLRP